MKREGPLLFVHLPKTGGTSLGALFEAGMAQDERVAVYGGELRLTGPDKDFVRRTKGSLDQLRLIYGHFSFGVHEILSTAPRYATILRDPVARVVSLYRHLAREPGLPFHRRIAAGMGLEEWVAGGETEMTNNHACRVLSGTPPESRKFEDSPAMLNLAKRNVERYFEFLGTMARFEDDVENLCRTLGLNPMPIPQLNTGPAGDGPTAGEVEVLRRRNALDIELWEWARSSES